jgi:hypothetical protein
MENLSEKAKAAVEEIDRIYKSGEVHGDYSEAMSVLLAELSDVKDEPDLLKPKLRDIIDHFVDEIVLTHLKPITKEYKNSFIEISKES